MKDECKTSAPSIKCPQCGSVSYNKGDIEHRYCGKCHQFHHEMKEHMQPIVVTVSATVHRLLAVLGKPEDVVAQLIDHAQQGVYRPGAWERMWLTQAFGDDWVKDLEPGDPYGRPDCEHIFQRPKKK